SPNKISVAGASVTVIICALLLIPTNTATSKKILFIAYFLHYSLTNHFCNGFFHIATFFVIVHQLLILITFSLVCPKYFRWCFQTVNAVYISTHDKHFGIRLLGRKITLYRY